MALQPLAHLSQQPELSGPGYALSLAAEKEVYRNCVDVHNLPPVFHYWSNSFVRPKLEAFGFSTPDEMFRQHVEKLFQTGGSKHIASIGAGNCRLEVDLASHLVRTGRTEFVVDCLDLNPDMLARGRAAAEDAAISAYINFIPLDLNAWSASQEYDVVIANQSLHHILNLENLFSEIKRALKPGGTFLVSDIIGRNGHQRWPEALDLVREFWQKLPPSYRYNRSLQRYEETYEDWDCSGESFEGIRAQEILALLLKTFHFELFIAFANIIDPFVDRAFGSNFNPDASWDRNFISEVHRRDEQELLSGSLKPTHLIAVMGTDPSVPTLFHGPLSPAHCLRDPSRITVAAGVSPKSVSSPYHPASWPNGDRGEAEFACRKVVELQGWLNRQTLLAGERSLWAQRRDREIEEAAHRIKELDKQLEDRAAWAHRLDGEIIRARHRIGELEHDLIERTAWAQRANEEVRIGTAFAQSLIEELDCEREQVVQLDRKLNEQIAARHDEAERLAWASALDRRFHHQLCYACRVIRGFVHALRRIASKF
jgi:SAM-dependent methyltransferase